MTLSQKILASISADWAVLTDPFFIGLIASGIVGFAVGGVIHCLIRKFR